MSLLRILEATSRAQNRVMLTSVIGRLSAPSAISLRNSGSTKARFSAVRYGNVVGSRGSVVPLFRELIAEGATAADHRRADDAVLDHLERGRRLRPLRLEMMRGGEIFVPKIPSMKMTDLVQAMAPSATTGSSASGRARSCTR